MEKSSIHVPNHQAAISLYVNVIPGGFFSPQPPRFLRHTGRFLLPACSCTADNSLVAKLLDSSAVSGT